MTAFGSVPKQKRFKVIQTFDVGMFEYDSGFVFMSLSNAQSLFGYNVNNSISNLEVFLFSTDNIHLIKKKLSEISEKNLIITDWIQRNSSFINALKVERNVMFIILTLIITVAAFNIISSMIMFVATQIVRLRTGILSWVSDFFGHQENIGRAQVPIWSL